MVSLVRNLWQYLPPAVNYCRACARLAIRTVLILAVLLATSLCCHVNAAITTFGDVYTFSPGAYSKIGDTELGILSIDDGSGIDTLPVEIGITGTGVGRALVTGLESEWIADAMSIGIDGVGRLDVLDSGLVTVTGPLVVGQNGSGHGTVAVEGLGSLLQVQDNSTIGASGAGFLRVGLDSFVDATSDPTPAGDTMTVGPFGEIEMAGGMLRTSTLVNNGLVYGDGQILSAVDVANHGVLATQDGNRLKLNQPLDNFGRVDLFGGDLDVTSEIVNNGADAEILLRNSILRAGTVGGLDNQQGLLLSLVGNNEVYGPVSNGSQGVILAINESSLIFHDAVDNVGGMIEVFPGSTITYLDDLSLQTSSTVSLLLDGATSGGTAQLDVSGTAALAGQLEFEFADAYVPGEGDAYAILTAETAIVGSFASTSLPSLFTGLSWDVDIDTDSVVLRVVSLPNTVITTAMASSTVPTTLCGEILTARPLCSTPTATEISSSTTQISTFGSIRLT